MFHFQYLQKIERKRVKRIEKLSLRKRGLIVIVSPKRHSSKGIEDFLNKKYLPPNLLFLLENEICEFKLSKLKNQWTSRDGSYKIPKIFSLTEKPDEAFYFLEQLTSAFVFQKHRLIKIDYAECVEIDLDAQVVLDIIIKDVISFYRKIKALGYSPMVDEIRGINQTNPNVVKLLYSVGSQAIHAQRQRQFEDIISYQLCIHKKITSKKLVKNIIQKDIDTTTLVDYVIDSLRRLNKELSQDQIEDLCTIIGEILINAEEHSTTQYRFSIGYFQEHADEGNHFGIFRLVILNFGKTIYEKFADPNCPNQEIVEKMKGLSSKYTERSWFQLRVLNEETLWTLYALQEGVTSVPPEKYAKRGNGSIRFIESFFNFKDTNEDDDFSRLTIHSGNTQIVFDGKYGIKEKVIQGENFKVMTFNEEGEIENKPDTNYVKYVKNYFPGTIISARIRLNEN